MKAGLTATTLKMLQYFFCVRLPRHRDFVCFLACWFHRSCLSACLSACLRALSACLPHCLPAVFLFVCVCVCVSVFLSVCLSVCLPVCLSFCGLLACSSSSSSSSSSFSSLCSCQLVLLIPCRAPFDYSICLGNAPWSALLLQMLGLCVVGPPCFFLCVSLRLCVSLFAAVGLGLSPLAHVVEDRVATPPACQRRPQSCSGQRRVPPAIAKHKHLQPPTTRLSKRTKSNDC